MFVCQTLYLLSIWESTTSGTINRVTTNKAWATHAEATRGAIYSVIST